MDTRFASGTSKLQAWSSQLYETRARFVSDLANDAVALLAIEPGERILDLGCGDGYLTEKLAGLGARVVGVDFSPVLVAAARERGLEVHLGNGEELWFDGAFDGVFSNAAMHWMRRADGVIAGVKRALVPGGRFVGEFAGARNAEIIRGAVHEALARRGIDPVAVDPWYLPSEAEYGALLEAGGLTITSLRLFDRPVRIDYPIGDWIRTFGSPYLTVLPDEERAPFLAEVTEKLRPSLGHADGSWTVDYTRLRFRAERPRS
jgi:trans-aconitate methyltransferase